MTKINQVLVNPYSESARDTFQQCLNISLTAENFGLEWTSKWGTYQADIDHDTCTIGSYTAEIGLKEPLIAPLRAEAD